MKVIHLGTIIQSTFAVIDDDGNAVQTYSVAPIQQNEKNEKDPLRISQLKIDSFTEAFNALANIKVELQEKLDANNKSD